MKPESLKSPIPMLSYRHAFHAGNHADVLKHLVQTLLLRHLAKKDKPFWVIDTHSGAGMYALDQGYATQNGEFKEGIARLWALAGEQGVSALPAPVADYLERVVEANRGHGPGEGMDQLRCYPGSPEISRQCLRPGDRLHCFELHSSDIELLARHFRDTGKEVALTHGDGFAGLKGLLPPPPRRALALIDPPYEDKRDYGRVLEALKDAHKRFPTGTYCVWFPLLQRLEARQFPDRLKRIADNNWLMATLSVRKPAADGFGMFGSGLYIINPPWTLPGDLETLLPWLRELLAMDEGAEFSLEHRLA